MFEYNDKGIRIVDTSLWIDAHKKVAFSLISHAHSDHIKKHDSILATPATISLYKHRNGNVHAVPLDYGAVYRLNDLRIELLPAGHILGSAQILIERDGMRLLYSGDINTSKAETAEPLVYKNADILIIESTFGLPRYKFPKKYEVIERLVNVIERCFDQGVVPVILGYSLGKSQEVIKILGDLNYDIRVHSTIFEISKIYEQFGVPLKNYQRYEGEDLKGRVMIIPPNLSEWINKKYLGNLCKIMVSGWAIDGRHAYRYRIDEAIPLSDHADYAGLLDYISKVDPKQVFVTHGFDEFVVDLRRQGINAQRLNKTSQLSLF